jgi:hypothetical protein
MPMGLVGATTPRSYGFSRRGDTPREREGIWASYRIFRRVQVASLGRCRSTRKNELMYRKARTLVSLEHPIGKCIRFRHLEVGCPIARIHVHELRIRRQACLASAIANRRNQIRPIHFPAVVHMHKIVVVMAEIVVIVQRSRHQLNHGTRRIQPAAGYIGALRNQIGIMEKIIGAAILLEEYDTCLIG